MRPSCALSIDVDGLDLYAGLHGLPRSVAGPQAWTRGVRRFLDLFARRGVSATFFLVGQDVSRPGPARDLAIEALRRGHELANHTLGHPYDLVRLSPDDRRREVEGGSLAIAELQGRRPEGFRAPGYTVDDALLRLVAATGHRYDSSAFPCPPYQAAKWAALGALRLRGRRSSAIRGAGPRFSAPRGPHRPPSAPSLVQAPISTTPLVRMPVIGGALLRLGGRWLTTALPGLLATLPMLNIELHAVDLVGVTEDGVHPSLALWPDPGRTSLAKKAATLEACLDILASRCRFQTLGEALSTWT